MTVYEGRYLRVTVVPTGNGRFDELVSRPGTMFDYPGGTLRVDRSYSNVPHVTDDGQYIRNWIHLVQDTAS